MAVLPQRATREYMTRVNVPDLFDRFFSTLVHMYSATQTIRVGIIKITESQVRDKSYSCDVLIKDFSFFFFSVVRVYLAVTESSCGNERYWKFSVTEYA